MQSTETYIAISQLKARYCRLLDTKDWAGFAALFTEDFALDASGSGGPIVQGRDKAVAMVRASIGDAHTVHQVHGPEIESDGDTAQAVWAMQDRVIWPQGTTRSGPASLTGYGHYHEHYVRRDGTWLIAASRLTRLHIDTPG